MNKRPLLSIGEASHVLGVSEAALRQWTDEGKIEAFVTPGGHRRYSRVTLRDFVSTQKRAHGIKDIVAQLRDTVPIHHQIAQTRFSSASWYGKLTNESQEQLARLGRELLNLVIRYVSEPLKRDETEELIREVGRAFGETLAMLGVSLTDSLGAFILHRSPLVNVTTRLIEERVVLDKRAAAAVSLVTQVMDEALIALVAAHQRIREAGRLETQRADTP